MLSGRPCVCLCVASLVVACQVDLPDELSPRTSADASAQAVAAADDPGEGQSPTASPMPDASINTPEGVGDAGPTSDPATDSEAPGTTGGEDPTPGAGASDAMTPTPSSSEPNPPPEEPAPVDPCSDGELSGDESDVDCGGSCEPCEDGRGCTGADDCTSAVCEGPAGSLTCSEPTCSDEAQNAGEADVDCGGGENNCPTCGIGQSCTADEQCSTNSCVDGTCAEATCEDGRKNGRAETDVDCGSVCGRCQVGQACVENSDCQSHRCVGDVCGESRLELSQAHVNDLCDTRIDLYLQLDNRTTQTINAEDIRIRYWFSDESDDSFPELPLDMIFTPGPFAINIDFQRVEVPAHPSANMYADITFAPLEMAPGFRSGLVFLGLRTTRFQKFDETNDYSFNQEAKVTMPDLALADFTTNYERTGLYRRIDDEWVLVSGTEPSAGVELAATAVQCE